MKFAHLADCHLGSWTIPELRNLNFESFQFALSECIKESVDFVLIAGDLFDSSYPPIDILKQAFQEFRKIKEARIPVFIIAGSHDYSVSGKTFLEVLEKAGFCKNVSLYAEKNGKIVLEPTLYKGAAIYGYPGKKAGLEVDEIKKIKLEDSPGLFKILMLHTAIKDAVRNPLIKSVDQDTLPNVDYLALGHLHASYAKSGRVYPGPTFPNNILELEELKYGTFFIFNNGTLQKKEIKIKEVYVLNLEVRNTLNIEDNIVPFLEKENLEDKIVILKLFGIVEQGTLSDISLKKVERLVKQKKAFCFLKSTSKLHVEEKELHVNPLSSEDMEDSIVKKFQESNPNKFNSLIHPLMRALQIDKLDDEKSSIFEERLISETGKILKI